MRSPESRTPPPKLRIALLAGVLVLPLALAAATVGPLHPFSNGQVADAVQMNENFAALKTTVDANAIAKIAAAAFQPCTAGEEGTQRYNSTAKKMEFCNGTAWTPLGGSGLKSMQVFTANGTWTKPAGVTTIEVVVTGGGGGGGSHNQDDAQGGGGAGGTSIKVIDVTGVTSVAVTVGAGGVGSVGNVPAYGAASTGGTSSFGSHCSATGGLGPANWAVGGLGGMGSGGDLNLRGSDGDTGSIDGGGNEESGGTGGASYWGGGGTGGTYWSGGRAGVNGSGGGGAHATTSNAGYAGGNGLVVVREFGP